MKSERSGVAGQLAWDENDALVAMALLSAGAAVIHATVIQAHFREWWLYGTFFAVAASAQSIWTFLTLRRPSRRLLIAGATGNAIVVFLWLLTRITGLPVGPEPWTPESLSLLDVAASVFEVVLVATAVMMLRRDALPQRTRVHLERPQVAVFTGAIVAFTYIAVTGGGHH
ncbi:MAG: hypothetical protein QOG21_1235 [Actinomycetota bacterium]|nr:hypothetical protein [Actinomycetota bacterium]